MTIAVLGIDLGKNSCSLVGLDAAGRVVLRRRMQREGVIAFGAKLPGCVVAMEACCGAHHMGRGDCQEFRVGAAIVDPTEVPDGTTQSTPHP